MTKQEMIRKFKDQAGFSTEAQAGRAYDAFVGLIVETLEKEGALALSGLGSFKIVERAARKGRNPRTGKEIAIAASKAVKFTPSKGLKEAVK